MTEQRKIIYNIISDSCSHMTAEEIFEKAKPLLPSIAIGTVYRNLALMVSSGEIRKIEMFEEPDRYDRNTFDHEHAKCEKCGRIVDISLDGLSDYIAEKTGLEITSYRLNVNYICPDCRNKDM